MVTTEVEIVRYPSEDEICEDVVPARANQQLEVEQGVPGGGVGDHVSATLNDCTEAQIGPKFVAEYMTFMLPESIGKGDSVVSQIIKEKFDIECAKSEPKLKTYASRTSFILGLFLGSLFLVIFMSYISIQTLHNKEKLNDLESKQYVKPILSDPILSSIETNNSQLDRTEFTKKRVTQNYKLPDIMIIQNKSIPKSNTSSEYHTIAKIDDTVSDQYHTTIKTSPSSTAINVNKKPHSTYNVFQNISDASILILKRISLSFDVHTIGKINYNEQDRVMNKIYLEFYHGPCTSFPECLKHLAYYPDVDYNFIVHSGGMVLTAKGWGKAQILDESIGILFVFRDTRAISEKMMYLYLLLINGALRCGYLEKEFSVKIVGNKFFRTSTGIDKFINIINKSVKQKFLIDDKDRFIEDSITLSEKTKPLCGFRSDCRDSCTNQECLQSVCTNDVCYVQCL